MKTLAYVLGFLVVFLAVGYSEPFRKTASDLYQESYRAQMQRLGGMSAAESRAEEYRKMYESCDRSHNCADVNQSNYRSRQDGASVPFAYSHVWQ